MNKKEIYSDFKENIKNLKIEEYDEADETFREYLIQKDLEIEMINSEKEIKDFLSKWIHLFRNSFYSEVLSEKIGLNYSEELAKKFHEKYLEIVIGGNSKDFYEDTVKSFI